MRNFSSARTTIHAWLRLRRSAGTTFSTMHLTTGLRRLGRAASSCNCGPARPPVRKALKVFDSTLNHLVFEFVQAYAAAIWPADDIKRSPFARVDTRHQGMELKALQWQLSVSNGTKQRFKATQDLDLTAEDVMVESKIGQRVRTYLMDLLLFKQPEPHAQSADAPTLLRNLLLPRTRKRARSGPASTATGALTFHNLPIALKRSKKEQ